MGRKTVKRRRYGINAKRAKRSAAPWTAARLTKEILKRFKSGKPMNYKVMFRDRPELMYRAIRRYGSWSKALIAHGLPYHKIAERVPRTKENVALALIKLAGKRKVIDLTKFYNPRSWLPSATSRLYGSLDEAARQLGLQVRRHRPLWTKEAVLEDVRARMARGECVSSSRMRAVATKTLSAGRRRFGSWARVLELCRQP